LNVFQQVDTAFTARHIVSAASSETGIAGALQHHVLFICRKNGGRYQSVEGITLVFMCGQRRFSQKVNPNFESFEESKSKVKSSISKK